MRNGVGSFSDLVNATRRASEVLSQFDKALEQMRMLENIPGQKFIDLVGKNEDMRRLLNPQSELTGRFHEVSMALQLQRKIETERKLLFEPSILERLGEAARLAQGLRLPPVLDPFRTSSDLLATKLSYLPEFDWAHHTEHLQAFNQTSAISELFAQSFRVDGELRTATNAFAATTFPPLGTLLDYSQFLNAAGLVLPRWPRVRLLTAAEKRRRFKARLKENVEPLHVRRAKSLVHRYELTLRELLDAAMADTYGEDWPESRLALCDCKDLLGKWKRRGGDALDHADYAHYARIMSHPEHFETIFEAGYDDAVALAELMQKAGRLRAASHHAHEFTKEDLRNLRLTWLTIEKGLLALTPDYDLDFIR